MSSRTAPALRQHRAGLQGLRLVLLVALIGLVPRAALAIQTIAVLDLDGYDISFDDAQVMTQGLRDGFLEEGTFDPLTGYDISEGMSAGQDAGIRQAREHLAQARTKMDAGDASGALRLLAEVLSLHEAAWSWVGRRPELADAHYYTAIALAKLGRNTDATSHLVECLYLHPGYHQDRAASPQANVVRLFAEAAAQLNQAERRTVPGARTASIGERLGARYVVSGYVVGDGTVHVSLFQDGRLITEATDYAEALPLYPGDPFFYDLAVLLVGNEANAAGSAATMPIGTPSTAEPSFNDFHEIPDVEPSEPSGHISMGSVGTSDGGHLTDQGSAYGSNTRRRQRGSEHKVRGVRYERKPVTETWWFWTGVTVAVAGGGLGLYFLLRDDTSSPPQTLDSDSYTITLDPSAIEAR